MTKTIRNKNYALHTQMELYSYLYTLRNENIKLILPIDIRYLQGEERETVEHKLKILKQEIKYIIKKLTDWKDFVFVDPHKKKAHAHCTHLQIALADPQTEICKRVQSCQPSKERRI